jgi:protein O-mannosyl-transferase
MIQWNKTYRDLLIICLLAAATAAVYYQVKDFDFTNYDDGTYVSENIAVLKGLSGESFLWAFSTTVEANWHPLTWISHMLDCQLFGLNPGAHHLVNLFFHILNTALLFLILKGATGAIWRSAFVAALFALHPLHVESVAWIAERKDVLSTLFWLLTTGAYLFYVRQPSRSRYLAVVILFALGLMAKPMLVTLPLMLLLMDYWPLGRFRLDPVKSPVPPPQPAETFRTGKKGGKKRKDAAKTINPQVPAASERRQLLMRIIGEKIPLLSLSIVSSVITFYAQQKGGAVRTFQEIPLPERIVNALVSYAVYLWKMIYPADLAVFYPFPHSWSLVAILGSALFIAGVTLFAIRTARGFPYVAFGWIWYVITLVPVIGLVKVGDAALSDRYTYITLIGPFIAITWGAADLLGNRALGKWALAVLAAIVLVVSTVLTYYQVGVWKNSEILFTHALVVTKDNDVALNNLGTAYIEEGRYEEAESQFRKLEEVKPNNAYAHYNMALVLPFLGKPDEALKRMAKALQINPGFNKRYQELGKFYVTVGQADRAITYFDYAIRTNKYDYKAYAGMAEALDLKGRFDDALRYYRMALEWRPKDARLQNNVGFILIRQGRIDEAIDCFREVVRINPNYARAHNNLGSALMIKKQVDAAIYQFEEALRIDPNYKTARENLQDVLAQKQKAQR